MNVDWKRMKTVFVVAGATVALVAGMISTVPNVYAGGTIKVDDDQWISLGMGVRTNFTTAEDASASGGQWSNTFGINNARLYVNGKIHKYLGFEFNTECFNCAVNGGGNSFGGNSNMGLLDAIGKFEFNELVNLWVGRMLVPTERGELNGPFYHSVFDGFRTPLNQSDFSPNFGAGGAGLYGRDNGATFYGKVHPGGTHLQYVAGVFTGLQSSNGLGPNQRNNIKYAGRITWNLLNEEKNPGYYTSGTYYGTLGDILAFGAGGEYQNTSAGTATNQSVYGNFTGDVLYEKVLPDKGVITFNAEYKRYWAQDLAAQLAGNAAPGTCYCMFNGTSVTAYAMYLFPQEVGIGRFQPYGRYTFVNSVYNQGVDEFEGGVNYIIAGHNARISAYYRNTAYAGPASGNNTMLTSSPGGAGVHQDSVTVALQFQY